MERLIQKEDIPDTLLPDDKTLCLPPITVSAWFSLLKNNSLFDMAKTKAPEGFVGGMSEEDTNKHLAWRYNGSCGRIVLSLLDPDNSLPKVSDAYAKIFSGNKVFLADLPSGSGAAAVSILCTLAELRKKSCLPRMPLTVVIVAGEISETARKYVTDQFSEIEDQLIEQAIWIDYEVVHWDVCDALSNTDLIKKLTLKSDGCDQRLLVVSNFSGLLESEGKWKEARPQFDELFRYSRDERSTAIWIESQKNNVPPFFNRLINWFMNLFKSILPEEESKKASDWYATAYVKIKHPIKEGDFPVHLSVVCFELPITGDK